MALIGWDDDQVTGSKDVSIKKIPHRKKDILAFEEDLMRDAADGKIKFAVHKLAGLCSLVASGDLGKSRKARIDAGGASLYSCVKLAEHLSTLIFGEEKGPRKQLQFHKSCYRVVKYLQVLVTFTWLSLSSFERHRKLFHRIITEVQHVVASGDEYIESVNQGV